jgi:hypothetical protein
MPKRKNHKKIEDPGFYKGIAILAPNTQILVPSFRRLVGTHFYLTATQ